METRIIGIKYNPRVIAVKDEKTYGRTSTEVFTQSELSICDYSDVKEIKEVEATVYDVYFHNEPKRRIINPSEVFYE